MNYPKLPDYQEFAAQIMAHSQLRFEYGAKGVADILRESEQSLRKTVAKLKKLEIDQQLANREPDNLSMIRRVRPDGPRRLWQRFDRQVYLDKLDGALLARLAGCILGSVVEGWSIEAMQSWARQIGDSFPPVDYWSAAKTPTEIRYETSPCAAYTKMGMDSVPVDDDIAYTLLGLLIMEDYGPEFTSEDVGHAWVKYLPFVAGSCKPALNSLRSGGAASKAAGTAQGNPYVQIIGATIRCDPWAYMAPGWPEKAAELAHRDACVSHRRNGIYGAMFLAAAQSAAFAVDHAAEAIGIGLTEIPKRCRLAGHVRWALQAGKKVKSFRQARRLVDQRFNGMRGTHTINNVCLIVFGLLMGDKDVTKVISQCVAMGLDNDCTAASAGSIVGAMVGKSGVPRHWYEPFNNTVRSYLIGKKTFQITSLVKRFARQAGRTWTATP